MEKIMFMGCQGPSNGLQMWSKRPRFSADETTPSPQPSGSTPTLSYQPYRESAWERFKEGVKSKLRWLVLLGVLIGAPASQFRGCDQSDARARTYNGFGIQNGYVSKDNTVVWYGFRMGGIDKDGYAHGMFLWPQGKANDQGHFYQNPLQFLPNVRVDENGTIRSSMGLKMGTIVDNPNSDQPMSLKEKAAAAKLIFD